jgi:hypothetical protein
MTNVAPLRVLSETLVDQFVKLAIEQGEAIENNDSRRANWLFDKAAVIENELTARGDQRMLLPLAMMATRCGVRNSGDRK